MHDEQMHGNWEGLWERYGAKLMLFARQQAPASADAEDIVQEAFVRFWRMIKSNQILSPALLFTLVKRIAIDCARRTERRLTRETEFGQLASPDQAWFDPPVEDRERGTQIESALRDLPAEQREVLVLKIWAGLTYDEIGKALEISPNTAASRYRYGLNQIKELLAPVLR